MFRKAIRITGEPIPPISIIAPVEDLKDQGVRKNSNAKST